MQRMHSTWTMSKRGNWHFFGWCWQPRKKLFTEQHQAPRPLLSSYRPECPRLLFKSYSIMRTRRLGEGGSWPSKLLDWDPDTYLTTKIYLGSSIKLHCPSFLLIHLNVCASYSRHTQSSGIGPKVLRVKEAPGSKEQYSGPSGGHSLGH